MPRKNLDSAVTDLAQAFGLLVRRMRVAGGTQDLSWTQTIVLKRLATQGPATIAELAREVGVKPQSMGAAIGALGELGWVTRTPHPTDGRQMNIELTVQGAAARDSAHHAKRAWLMQAVAQLAPQEQEALFAAGEIIKRLVEL
jgi:DNA-binding MarR family transcriptional regulator